ncbi:uncharacterized protein LOC120003245 isoform X2 [Tripterygium wilfordii]|uniref:uncharacterized protein LOC120003245 isoform X2 n=1 Tax=Tripterygium wilfordii TaxID=458696 RepID=UPI0018F7F429|nr:uncharacterized protein LOC120003245 isoform X2 [Tripterygium wilfordii]
MGKRSHKRPVRYEKDPSGCMWGLISIFDFRHGRTTQKLLSDRRRGGRHASGAANSRNKRDKLIHLNENCQEAPDGEESTKLVADANKPSVKELIEEEMFSDQDTTKETSNVLEHKNPDSENGSQKKRNHKKTNRSRSRSCDIDIDDIDSAKNLDAEHSCREKLEKEIVTDTDMEKLMNKLCLQIKVPSSLKHEQHGEVNFQPEQKILDLKEKMEKVIKLFITQKIISVKHIAEDGDVHLPENLINVLQILCEDDELFLKLVQDPSSILNGQCMQNASVEKGEDSKSHVGPEVSDHEPRILRESDELVKRKQHKFFRRKVKSMERPQSKGSKTSPQDSNTIIILKPGLQNSETESSNGSSPDSHSIVRKKGPSERIGSHFFITEIKRKLKHAMGKERPEIYTDDVLRTSYESHHLGTNGKGTKENVGMNSPSKDHFFIERIARPPTGVKKGDKINKMKHCERAVENEAASFPKKRVFNIYVEAKKHLSEMLNNGDEDVVSSSRLVPKTLGRILSLPEYNTSPFGSPGRDWGHGFVTAQMRLSKSEKCQKHENSFSNMGMLTQNLETQSSISNVNADKEVQHPKPNAENLSEVVIDDEAKKTISSVVDKMTCKGDEISKSPDTVTKEEMISLGTHPEPSISTVFTRDDQDDDICEACDEQNNSECLSQEAREGNEQSFSPSASPSNAISKSVPETNVYTPERPSPVSILLPLVSEDDISPASTKSESELPVQPLQIQFEECDSSTAESIHMKTYMDDKEQIVEYIKVVLQASDLKCDEIYLMSSSSEELLDPLLFQELGLEFFSDELCCNKKLLFDCINEVLVDLYQPYFGCSPWSSFVKPSIRPIHDMKNATLEVWEGVNWHLTPLPLPHTLDQMVKKDLAKTGTWMDLRLDTESIIFEMGEVIFEELMGDTVLSCINGSSETGELLILDEMKENQNVIVP